MTARKHPEFIVWSDGAVRASRVGSWREVDDRRGGRLELIGLTHRILATIQDRPEIDRAISQLRERYSKLPIPDVRTDKMIHWRRRGLSSVFIESVRVDREARRAEMTESYGYPHNRGFIEIISTEDADRILEQLSTLGEMASEHGGESPERLAEILRNAPPGHVQLLPQGWQPTFGPDVPHAELGRDVDLRFEEGQKWPVTLEVNGQEVATFDERAAVELRNLLAFYADVLWHYEDLGDGFFAVPEQTVGADGKPAFGLRKSDVAKVDAWAIIAPDGYAVIDRYVTGKWRVQRFEDLETCRYIKRRFAKNGCDTVGNCAKWNEVQPAKGSPATDGPKQAGKRSIWKDAEPVEHSTFSAPSHDRQYVYLEINNKLFRLTRTVVESLERQLANPTWLVNEQGELQRRRARNHFGFLSQLAAGDAQRLNEKGHRFAVDLGAGFTAVPYAAIDPNESRAIRMVDVSGNALSRDGWAIIAPNGFAAFNEGTIRVLFWPWISDVEDAVKRFTKHGCLTTVGRWEPPPAAEKHEQAEPGNAPSPGSES